MTTNFVIVSLPFSSLTPSHPYTYVYVTVEVYRQQEVFLNCQIIEQLKPQGRMCSLFYMEF